MTRLFVLVEGQTEEAFVNELLVPSYVSKEIYLTPIVTRTSAVQSGGVQRYSKIKPQIEKLCKQDRQAWVTTLLDLYALPNSFPGKNSLEYPAEGSGKQKAEFLERTWANDMNQPNFIPNLLVHEFEALLFSYIEAFAMWTDKEREINALRAVASGAAPEDINDGPQTAPSKRILTAMPAYEKAFHGPLIACDIGLDRMRTACPHFDGWLRKIDGLVETG